MKGKNLTLLAAIAVFFTLSLCTVSCRRPLFVAGDDFYSAVLHTDWRSYTNYDPDGMTVWFYPKDDNSRAFRYTSANVRLLEFYLPSGNYDGVVVDYSPEEYSRQAFVGMDYASTAAVKATPYPYQPDSLKGLYGPDCFHKEFPRVNEKTGLYEVSNQPERMALDTLDRMYVDSGEYGYYIPYEERNTYQENLVIQHYYAYPVTPIWKFRIRLYVTGIDYLYDLEGSVAGLADGRFLALNKPSEDPCLLSVTGWESQRIDKDRGYVAVTIDTFGPLGGLRPVESRVNGNHETYPRTQMKESAVIADWTGTRPMEPSDVRLNLRFLLRDRKTVVYCHYDIGDRIVSFDEELVLRLDLLEDFGDHPDLPFVEPYNGTGFDADVRPWEDGGEADVPL